MIFKMVGQQNPFLILIHEQIMKKMIEISKFMSIPILFYNLNVHTIDLSIEKNYIK